MLQKLEEIQEKYENIGRELSETEVISNQKEFQKLMKQHNSLESVVLEYKKYKDTRKEVEDIKEIIKKYKSA